ncbi:MAG: D-2-hydroxyacid dehydrogenase [Micromonosporaceae bacterium]|nr:D-2-hydroxyacid dehydrogenase [Micromonosporaceae bacterium]
MATTPGDRPVLVVLGSSRPPHFEQVEERAEVRQVDDAGLPKAFPGADALFVWDFLSHAVPDAWPHAGRLRWVHIASAGVDTLMFDGLRDSDVVLTNSRGVFDGAIAEYVLGAVLAFAKDLPATLEHQRAGRWRHRETERVAGKRALVVGSGPIGRAIARLLRAAGLRVAGVGRRARSGDPDFGDVHAADELAACLPCADYVICAAPLTDATRGMFDADAFAVMQRSARFVNVGRGAHVVTDDLVTALASGEIAGAALDVFEAEPLPRDSALWSMPNVMVSPHMSGDFIGWESALAEVFADNFQRWLSSQPLRNVVDKTLGYPTGRPAAPHQAASGE